MKKLYWRPRGIPASVLVLIAAISLIGLAAVEFFERRQQQPYYAEKARAAKLAAQGMEIIRAERLRINPIIDRTLDPADSGLIGMPMTLVTSDAGLLSSKQTSVNPNFAAVFVQWLRDAGVRSGDSVAVACSGSFPALNICAYAAMRTLNLRPIIISSASASQYGANDPKLLWLDMERVLHEYDSEQFPYRAVAASIGGVEDRAVGLSAEGRALLETAIERNGLKMLRSIDFRQSVDQRMAEYAEHAAEGTIKAYLNIGGGTVSVGTSLGMKMVKPGLNRRKPSSGHTVDSVMHRFLDQGVPVIHATHIEQLARTYGLPESPRNMPRPEQGGIFSRKEYNTWLAAGVLLVIVVSLYAFVRSEIGRSVLQSRARPQEDLFHEPMV